jgi:hypothetical protein
VDWAEFDKNLDDASLPDSCFVFGLHKSGSTMMHKMVREVCEQAGIPGVNIPGVGFSEGVRPEEWSSDEALIPIFRRKKLFYGFRFLPSILKHPDINIREKKFVLLVRDPRDALVSQFFSYGGKHLSHKLPKKNKEAFLEQIQKNADLDIDDYVVKMAKSHIKKMASYLDSLDFSKGLIRHYEDVYYDKFKFLKEVFEYFGIDVDESILADVAKRHDVRPEQEDPTQHIRKGAPGDYLEKLKPETIRKLNGVLAEMAATYGYDLR